MAAQAQRRHSAGLFLLVVYTMLLVGAAETVPVSSFAQGTSPGERENADGMLQRLAQVEAEFQAQLPEIQALKREATQKLGSGGGVGGVGEPVDVEGSSSPLGRKMLTTTSDADAFTHVSSDGSLELAISSDTAVAVEDVRFAGATLGITSDTDLISLSSGRVDVAGSLYVSGVDVSSGGGSTTHVGYYARPTYTTGLGANTFYTVNNLVTSIDGGYNSGHLVPSTGVFTAPVAGYYITSGQLRYDGVGSSYTRLMCSIDGSNSYSSNCGHGIIGNGVSTDYDTITISSVVYLTSGQTVEFKAYTYQDTSWVWLAESSFSVALLR